MAGDPLSLRVKVDPGALLLAERVSEAVRAAKAELRDLHRQVDEAIAKGQEVDQKIRERIAYLEGVQRQAAQAQQMQQQVMKGQEQLKNDLKAMRFATRYSQIRSLSSVAQGDVSSMLELVKDSGPLLGSLGMNKLAQLVKTAGPAAALAGITIERIQSTISEVRGDDKVMRDIISARARGELSAGEAELFARRFNGQENTEPGFVNRVGNAFRSLTIFGSANNHAMEALNKAQRAAGLFGKMTAEEQSKILGGTNAQDKIREAIERRERELSRGLTDSEKDHLAKTSFFAGLNEWNDKTQDQIIESIMKKGSELEQRAAARWKSASELYRAAENKALEEIQYQRREDRMGGTSDLRTARFED